MEESRRHKDCWVIMKQWEDSGEGIWKKGVIVVIVKKNNNYSINFNTNIIGVVIGIIIVLGKVTSLVLFLTKTKMWHVG